MSSQNLLEIKHVKKLFSVPKGMLHAVDDVSFSLKQGETLGIVGESGCGKSTLGRVILRLHEPTAGKILFKGMDITTFSKEEMRQMRQHMQIIFQDPYASLNPRMTVSQIIEEPLTFFRIYKSDKERRAKVAELMELIGLPQSASNSYPHEFDGGRRQRIVIARALAINPSFIVCDEPVSALDVSVQAQILNLMVKLQKQLGLTYMFISHDLSVVKHISDHVGVMYLGQLIEKATKSTFFKRPLHPYSMALLSAIPSVNVLDKKDKIILKGEISSPINPQQGCRFAPRCSFAQGICLEKDPEWKEVEAEHFVACHRVEELAQGMIHYH
ncbi:ABC transporter ATP-binding protein [uncultured Brevibacillus sp.]|uniref:ABC transporter ATP-binding protein n=1 Tax=uncultured Brevibacillus sp. TaxID=169970 RepID=UPI0025940E9B|nr:oligopeptide/dipeptide ABC transporter ATP-binding protein [uncultured Brevibacillus sp.]